MVSRSEARGLDYGPTTLTDASFVAGVNEGGTVSAGNVAEFAVAEIGEHGSFGDLVAVIFGQNPDPQLRTSKGKPYFDVYEDDGAGNSVQIHAATELRLIVRNTGDRDGPVIMPWRNIQDLRNGDASVREVLTPQEPIAREGKIVAVQLRNQSADIIPLFNADTNWRLPALSSEG